MPAGWDASIRRPRRSDPVAGPCAGVPSGGVRSVVWGFSRHLDRQRAPRVVNSETSDLGGYKSSESEPRTHHARDGGHFGRRSLN